VDYWHNVGEAIRRVWNVLNKTHASIPNAANQSQSVDGVSCIWEILRLFTAAEYTVIKSEVVYSDIHPLGLMLQNHCKEACLAEETCNPILVYVLLRIYKFSDVIDPLLKVNQEVGQIFECGKTYA
jgi:hypothetical protein